MLTSDLTRGTLSDNLALVNLDDAIRQAQLLVPQLKGRDAVAVHSLLELAKKVRSARGAVRQLADAIAPEAGLNQTRLFDE